MITRRFSSEPRERISYDGRHAYFHSAYFRGEWRRSWPKLICYTLFLFFVLPLPILFGINSRSSWAQVDLSAFLTRMLRDNIWVYCFAAAALAVFAGMLATRYLTRRSSVDFYHSLPVRREGLLIMNWLSGLFHFLFALAVNVLLSLVILATVAEMLLPLTTPLCMLFGGVGYMLLVFLFFYTLTVCCGMLCGTSVMQVMLVGLTQGAFPLFRLLYLAFADMVTSRVDIDYFYRQPWGWTSPLIRLAYLSEGHSYAGVYALQYPFAWWETVLWLVATVALFFVTLLLYRCRRVERAGVPVVFGGVAVTVKWVVTVLGTMAMGWLFWELGDMSVFWLFFGFLLGGFLSFLLINTILTKNPKQMFEGWRRLAVYLVIFCVGTAGLGYAVSTVEKLVPQKIERIAIQFDGDAYNVPYYTDPAVIDAWIALWETDPNENPYRAMQNEFYAGFDEFVHEEGVRTFYCGNRTVNISAYVDVGPFVIPYSQRSYIREDAEELLRAVADSAEFETAWDAMMAGVADGYYMSDAPDADDDREIDEWGGPVGDVVLRELFESVYEGCDTKKYISRETVRMLVEELPEDINFDFFQSTAYAQVNAANLSRIHTAGLNGSVFESNRLSLHVTANMPALYRETLGLDEEGFYGALADSILKEHGGVYVARHLRYEFTPNSEGVMYVTDRGQIMELLRGLSVLDTKGSARRFSDFTVLEEDYAVAFPGSGSDQAVYLIKGKVPTFVSEALG